jgi:uncharacterized membrane protein YbhN (UPF0104 family)
MSAGRRLRYALLVLGSVVFVVVLRSVGLGQVRHDVAATGWWLLAVLGAWGLGYALNAATLAVLLGPDRHRVGPLRLLGVTVSGFAMNYATPVVHMGGEPLRVLTLAEDVGLARAAFATVAYKLTNAVSALVYWTFALSAFALAARGAARDAALVLAVLSALAFVAAVLLALGRLPLAGPLGRAVVRRIGPSVRTLLGGHEATASAALAELRSLPAERPRACLVALALEVLSRAVMGLEFFFILHALGGGTSLLTSVAVDGASSLLLNTLFFVPFELGVREGGLYAILPALGLPPALGVSAAVVNRLRELFWIGLGLIWGHLLAASPRRRAVLA